MRPPKDIWTNNYNDFILDLYDVNPLVQKDNGTVKKVAEPEKNPKKIEQTPEESDGTLTNLVGESLRLRNTAALYLKLTKKIFKWEKERLAKIKPFPDPDSLDGKKVVIIEEDEDDDGGFKFKFPKFKFPKLRKVTPPNLNPAPNPAPSPNPAPNLNPTTIIPKTKKQKQREKQRQNQKQNQREKPPYRIPVIPKIPLIPIFRGLFNPSLLRGAVAKTIEEGADIIEEGANNRVNNANNSRRLPEKPVGGDGDVPGRSTVATLERPGGSGTGIPGGSQGADDLYNLLNIKSNSPLNAFNLPDDDMVSSLIKNQGSNPFNIGKNNEISINRNPRLNLSDDALVSSIFKNQGSNPLNIGKNNEISINRNPRFDLPDNVNLNEDGIISLNRGITSLNRNPGIQTKPGFKFSDAIKIPRIPGIQYATPALNVVFTGYDIYQRKSAGQTDQQALLGAGSSAATSLVFGAAAKAALTKLAVASAFAPVPGARPLALLFLLGAGIMGSMAGGAFADSLTGVNKSSEIKEINKYEDGIPIKIEDIYGESFSPEAMQEFQNMMKNIPNGEYVPQTPLIVPIPSFSNISDYNLSGNYHTWGHPTQGN